MNGLPDRRQIRIAGRDRRVEWFEHFEAEAGAHAFAHARSLDGGGILSGGPPVAHASPARLCSGACLGPVPEHRLLAGQPIPYYPGGIDVARF